MKITFPNFGNAKFAVKSILDDLEIDYILPEPGNNEILELGSYLSPQEICLPFKIMMGEFINCIKKGADTILLTGSCGPCRFGQYCELQMNILKKSGYNINLIVLESPASIGFKEFINRIGKMKPAGKISKKDSFLSVINAYKIINLIDSIEQKARYLSGFEVNIGDCKNILRECKNEALKTKGSTDMLRCLKKYSYNLKNLQLDNNKNPLKIALIGEIYTNLEPLSNLYIEDKLMDFGVSTYKNLCPSWWARNTLWSPLKLNSLDLRFASSKYLPCYIGGYGRESIGEAVLSQRHGFNGAIQIFPMGCMPEIVSKSILPNISKDLNYPIMSLIMDEMTGETGYDTRIEAFLDLLERRRKKCAI